MNIRVITRDDREWVGKALKNLWGSEEMITRGKLINLKNLPGFIAEEDGRKVGLITYVTARRETTKQSDEEEIATNSSSSRKDDFLECEITSLNALIPGKGIGTKLIDEVQNIAKKEGYSRLVVITTNDNTNALHFYQKRGFFISAIRVNIIKEYRKLKPQIPMTGNDGIPIRDEIELEKLL